MYLCFTIKVNKAILANQRYALEIWIFLFNLPCFMAVSWAYALEISLGLFVWLVLFCVWFLVWGFFAMLVLHWCLEIMIKITSRDKLLGMGFKKSERSNKKNNKWSKKAVQTEELVSAVWSRIRSFTRRPIFQFHDFF